MIAKIANHINHWDATFTKEPLSIPFQGIKVYVASVTKVGEIFAIAVDPDFHGRGCGKPLTISGLNYLANAGADLGMLYVEADNKPAIRIYEDIGFTHFSTNRAYRNSV